MKVLYGLAIFLIVGGLLYHFAALDVFNLFVPKDAESKLVARDVHYGPEAREVLDIYAPKISNGPLPILLFFHGGSWSSGNKNPYEFVGRALAARGFLTLVPNYRLHPQNPYPSFVEDAALALDWATRHGAEFDGDNHKVFAMGHSAGAYNVALAVLDKHYLATLGTDVSSIKGVATLAGPLDFLPLDTAVSIDVFGKITNLTETQPTHFARADAPPFLILQGSADQTVKPRNAINLNAALEKAGAQASLKIYPDVSHVGIMLALAKPLRGFAPTLGDLNAFFKAHSN